MGVRLRVKLFSQKRWFNIFPSRFVLLKYIQFRILKLAQSWETMRRLLSTISNSVGPIGNITLILGLVIYIFALMGMKMFGKSYTPNKFGEDGVPRWNFNDFWHAFMMVFRVLCGEWIEPLWDCMRATSPAAAIPFFIPAFVIGNFIVSWITP